MAMPDGSLDTSTPPVGRLDHQGGVPNPFFVGLFRESCLPAIQSAGKARQAWLLRVFVAIVSRRRADRNAVIQLHMAAPLAIVREIKADGTQSWEKVLIAE